MEKNNFVILHHLDGEFKCAVCKECTIKAEAGLAVFILDPEMADGRGMVCPACAREKALVLSEELEFIQHLNYLKVRVDVNLRELYGRRKAVAVLGKILEFNEKKDVSYIGETLGNATETIAACLDDLHQASAYANQPDDDLPF